MIELRWYRLNQWSDERLQFRTRGFLCDASGALCGTTEWSEWQDVPFVDGEQ